MSRGKKKATRKKKPAYADDVIEKGSQCFRSPCGIDVKVSRKQVDEARGVVRVENGQKDKIHRPHGRQPLIVAYGGGVDSTAILVGLAQLVHYEGREEFRPDWILFADTGAEKAATYEYLAVVNEFLETVGFPQVTVVCNSQAFTSRGWGSHRTLEQKCLNNQTMPSISASLFSRAECSVTWKHEPQNNFVKFYTGLFDYKGEPRPRVRSKFRKGHVVELPDGRMIRLKKIVKAIGYDASEKDREKKGTYRIKDEENKAKEMGMDHYAYWTPLIEWGWDRARCIAEIEYVGLPVPPKSSCYFCGAMKKAEIMELAKNEPGKLRRALLIEEVARYGRHPSKGRVKGLGGGWAWADFCVEEGLISIEEMFKITKKAEEIIRAAPKTKGSRNSAETYRKKRVTAFTKKGMGIRGECSWDRYDMIPPERRNPDPEAPLYPNPEVILKNERRGLRGRPLPRYRGPR